MNSDKRSQDGYFFVNNEIFSEEISSNAKLIYIYLCKCADCFGKSWPAHNTISSACSLSVSSVKLAIKELTIRGIITISHRYREEGGKSSNLYMIMNRSQSNRFWCSPKIFKTNISNKAKLVYFYFCRCCNQEGTCYPAHRTTAAACMVSISTVRNAIKELVETKILGVINRYRGNNGQTSNLYTVLSPIVEEVCTAIKEKKAAAIVKLKKTGHEQKTEKRAFPKLVANIQSYINRGLRHYIAGGMVKIGYERTIPSLRKNHMEGL